MGLLCCMHILEPLVESSLEARALEITRSWDNLAEVTTVLEKVLEQGLASN